MHLSIGSRAKRKPDGTVYSHGQYESFVIIGVFADQVYASGRTDDKSRLLPEPIGKQRDSILFKRNSGGIHRVFSKVKDRWRCRKIVLQNQGNSKSGWRCVYSGAIRGNMRAVRPVYRRRTILPT